MSTHTLLQAVAARHFHFVRLPLNGVLSGLRSAFVQCCEHVPKQASGGPNHGGRVKYKLVRSSHCQLGFFSDLLETIFIECKKK